MLSSRAGDVDEAKDSALTTAEQRVLGVLFKGRSNKEIAVELACSIKTVEFHISNILRKTGTGSRTHLLARQLAITERDNPANLGGSATQGARPGTIDLKIAAAGK